MTTPIRVLVTGAAGQIGYSLVLQVGKGDVFGKDKPVTLVLLDIEPMKTALDGVVMEINDCALPLVKEVIATSNEQEAFTGIDCAFLVGAMPRKAGMERKDLLEANVKIFKSQGRALAQWAKPTCKVLVVGNPANTNACICAKYASPTIPAKNISAMTRLDHNRTKALIAARTGACIGDVSGVIIWGNHSATQYPDVRHAKVTRGGASQPVYEAIGDENYLHTDFISTIQKRGAAIIAARKLSSAMSAAKAACDHIHDWFNGTEGDWVSMAVSSDGSYGIPAGVIYSFPVRIKNGEWSVVQGLGIDDFSRGKMDATLKELQEEREEAEKACAD